ncbi:MAG: DinB family protein [Pyrinomonadaceae bacterium]
MTYQNIEDIYIAIDDTRRRLAARVETLSAAQQTFRLSDGAWSIAELVEHVSIIEGRMIQLVGMLLKKAESMAAERADAVPPSFQPFSLEEMAKENRDKKFEAPVEMRPSGTIPLSDSLAKLQDTRAALHDLRPRLEAADLNAVSYPHPVLGDLNLAQWLAFIGLHEERHLRQIKAVINAPEFAGQAGG